MRCRALGLIVGGVLLITGSAAAEEKHLNRLLQGAYAFSGEATCLVSPGGFNQNFTPLGPPDFPLAPFPFVTSFSIQGVRTFNGDGTGRVGARTVGIGHPFVVPVINPPDQQHPTEWIPANRGGARSSDVEAHFTYEVAPDRTFTVEHPNGFSGTSLTGTAPSPGGPVPAAGVTFTITDFPRLFGGISQDHRTLTLAVDEPHIETVTFSTGVVQHRICHRSRILLKLKGGN